MPVQFGLDVVYVYWLPIVWIIAICGQVSSFVDFIYLVNKEVGHGILILIYVLN